ncbi:hypothetical protein Psch_00882 [Pelotomaculum schinkii]|uniref:Hemoglobin and hemoglobin-haptoglobin-binding protein 3 n=1 Tax=Pelotomaculum schinkii TaxID=78350 RepID=A0A4Y7RE89_9FIRM|nr:hypothetical protein [Pelotomaculum schinkii]TEB07335.1 hypothetical protein Psch_00882 [Pelotomaculum schinkii]
MQKIMIGLLLIIFCLGTAGCPAQKQVQEPAPKPLVVPETSKVGFSPVDLNNAPDVVKNIASDISKREQATWVQVNGTNYLLASAGEKATGSRVEITDITQKIPAQDFVWLDVKAKYTSVKEGDKSNPVTAVSLNLTSNRSINGVGFEITKTATVTQTTPTPATPSPSTTTPATPATPAPTTPTPAAPSPTPTPTPAPSKTAPETPAKKTTPAESKTELEKNQNN